MKFSRPTSIYIFSHHPIPKPKPLYRLLTTTSPCQSQSQPQTLPPKKKNPRKPNPPASKSEILSLLKNGGEGGRWTLTAGGMGIERKFKFKGFMRTWVCYSFLDFPCLLYYFWFAVEGKRRRERKRKRGRGRRRYYRDRYLTEISINWKLIRRWGWGRFGSGDLL